MADVQTTTSTLRCRTKQPEYTHTVHKFPQGEGRIAKLISNDPTDEFASQGFLDEAKVPRCEADFRSGLTLKQHGSSLEARHGKEKQTVYGELSFDPDAGTVAISSCGGTLLCQDDGRMFWECQPSNGPVSNQFRVDGDGRVVGRMNQYYGAYMVVEGEVDSKGNLQVHDAMSREASPQQYTIEAPLPLNWFMSR
ncbi:MAG: hypothetical protein HY319_16320 [Armatimonadetes bacterium]|nr:hypothetical protein [Armatimonadota bacterium]